MTIELVSGFEKAPEARRGREEEIWRESYCRVGEWKSNISGILGRDWPSRQRLEAKRGTVFNR